MILTIYEYTIHNLLKNGYLEIIQLSNSNCSFSHNKSYQIVHDAPEYTLIFNERKHSRYPIS